MSIRILSITQDKMVQWRYLCCVRWVHCRLKEPKRSCWTCEAISHKYDPQRNDEEERLSRLTQKIHLPWLHPRLYVNLVMSKGVDIWQRITGLCTDVAFKDLFKICSLTLCHRVAGQKFQTGVQSWLLLWLEMSLYIPVFLLFLPFPSQWSFPNQFSCSLGHTSLSRNGFVCWCKWRTSCQSICPSQFQQLVLLHQEALRNK